MAPLSSKQPGETRPRKYRARVREDGITYFLGRYDTPEEAKKAQEEFKRAGRDGD